MVSGQWSYRVSNGQLSFSLFFVYSFSMVHFVLSPIQLCSYTYFLICWGKFVLSPIELCSYILSSINSFTVNRMGGNVNFRALSFCPLSKIRGLWILFIMEASVNYSDMHIDD